MRKLLYILLTAVALTLVMGCSRSVDKRLVLADTLMWTAPDSSLKILTAINRDSLQDKENLAYHALLLTQAQFRCNGNCDSDTLINLALSHYSDNHNREHYTRALLYKGSFYEVHDNPVEAIKWYKRAEDNADTTDYRNLAQINMRMGMLYYDNFADYKIDLDKFNKSLNYYTLLGDIDKILLAHSYIGKIFRLTNQDSAKHHLDIAISLAKDIKDSTNLFDCITSKSLSCFMNRDYKQAKDLAVFCIHNGPGYINDHTYYNAARAYCALNEIDSAWSCVRNTEMYPDNLQLLSIRYLTLYELYDSIGDIQNFKKYNTLFDNLTDSISSNSSITNLLNIEEDYQIKNQAIELEEKNFIRNAIMWLFLILVILVLCFLGFLIKVKKDKRAYRETVRLIKDNNIKEKEQLNIILSQLENRTDILGKEMMIKDSYYQVLTEMVSHHIIIMDRLANVYETGSEKNFKNEFKEIAAKYSESESFWKAAEQYVNKNYNGLLAKITNKYPKISKKQTKIVILHCLGFDYVNCAVIFGTSTSSMGVICSRLADKLGTELSLKKFIDEIKSECLSNK